MGAGGCERTRGPKHIGRHQRDSGPRIDQGFGRAPVDREGDGDPIRLPVIRCRNVHHRARLGRGRFDGQRGERRLTERKGLRCPPGTAGATLAKMSRPPRLGWGGKSDLLLVLSPTEPCNYLTDCIVKTKHRLDTFKEPKKSRINTVGIH